MQKDYFKRFDLKPNSIKIEPDNLKPTHPQRGFYGWWIIMGGTAILFRLFGDRLLRPRCHPGSLAGPIRLVQGGHFHGRLHVFCHCRRHGDGYRETHRSIRAQTDTDLRVSDHRNRFHSSEPGDPTLAVLRGLHPHGRGLEWNLSWSPSVP